MSPETRRLRYAIALAHYGHFGRAASVLGISQPALSLQIRQLENEVGAELFARTSKGAEPTRIGAQFLAEVGPLLGQLDEAMMRARAGADAHGSRAVIGFVDSAGHCLIPAMIQRAAAEGAPLHVEVVEVRANAGVQAVWDREVDALFFHRYDSADGLASRSLLREGLVVTSAADSPLAERDSVSRDELRHERWVIVSRHRGVVPGASAISRCLGFEPAVVAEVDSVRAAMMLVAAGRGIGLLPCSSAALSRHGIASVPVRDAYCDVAIGWHPDHRESVVGTIVRLADDVAVRWRSGAEPACDACRPCSAAHANACC